ncbi:MAG: ATP-dependent RNA helicase [Robiginitomaculum sp.]|nr:MAG: ATP-dependent RNA helicase [Robiginitomaculum sp.]
MSEFEGVVPALAKALAARGYEKLTPVQEAVIDQKYDNVDMLVSAQTGSGKTVAFGLALAPTLLQGEGRFEKARTPLALAIAPTRELALQVKRELEWLYAETGVKIASCVGGMDMQTERKNLSRGVHIVVGTPGRLVDHVKRGSLKLGDLRALVLDEADEMLDMGFRDDLEEIMRACAKDRRTLMFSATVPNSIASLAKKYQNDAVRINTASGKDQHVDIEYRALTCHQNDRENAIINVLRFYESKGAIVFCGTRVAVNRMTSRFNNRGMSCVALSGELSQKERSNALQAMRDGRARVCIATDVAARGIDLPNLDLVIHADLPKNREGLLHRSGRTGRAGRKGTSVLIVPLKGQKRTDRLLKSAGIKAVWATPPTVKEIKKRDEERLLADPSLSAALAESEAAFAQELIEKFGAEQMAGAFVRLYRAGQSAPEELSQVSEKHAEQKNQREDFTGGIWFKLSVGRKQNAEPRWLLPLLINEGGVNKKEIGSIKISQDETYVEIAPNAVDAFTVALGASMQLEGKIDVERQEGRPQNIDTRGGSGRDRNSRPRRDKREHGGDRGDRSPRGDRGDRGPRGGQDRGPRGGQDRGPRGVKGDYSKPKFDKNRDKGRGSRNATSDEGYNPEGSASLHDEKAWNDDGGLASPKRKKDSKGKPRKPHKKKLARAAAKAAGKPKKDQGAQLQRKKRTDK